ncbi:MAG: double-strand break repair protein AddB [Pseudomonadota bacterium]
MHKNIFNIKPNSSFLSSLAQWVWQNYPDQLYLSSLTILLPSRRACRELKKIFLNLSKNEAVILPKILAIGDVDYDEVFFSDSGNKIEYQLRLIEAIKNWNHKTNLFGKNISTAALAAIADNLQTFLDEIEKEGLSLDNLLAIDDSELASHKQQILKFLQYFSSVWQNTLLKDGLISAAKNRNLMLKNYNEHLQKNGSQHPIIAAGSTGSVVAASELLKTIASLENGHLVLFGLDQNLDENIWQKIAENHPQFMLKKLLEKIGIVRKNVVNIDSAKQSDVLNLCSLAMLPIEFIFEKQPEKINQINSLTKIETENEFAEAKIIALLLRQALETKEKTAALISNDKNLIQLVKANLLAWQIEIDDSASSNLAESELANYLFLISQFASNDFSAINLLAVLKHPLSGFSAEFLKVLEIKVLRNVVKFSNFDDLIAQIKNNDELLVWLKQIAKIFQPLISEFQKEKIDFKKIVALHFDCLSSLRGGNADATIPSLNGNEELLEFYQEILNTKTNFNLEPQSYNQLLQNLLKNYQFRKSGKFHPRLHILSTMEARLMSYDLTIVSGLCEGEFPSKSSDDWLGNKIRAEFGLSSGAKKIGIAAYDFCNYLGNKEVILLYPKNQNNAPTIKSRFLLKLETVLKLNGWEDYLKDGEEYLQLLNLDSKKPINASRANPTPEQKLQKISATDISKWLRNPYYIYAKRILQLKPLKQIEQDASFAEFGNFVHKALEEFVKNYPKIDLEKFAKEIFSNYFPDQATHLLWWPRFENIAKWFLKQEIELRKNLQKSFVEIEAEVIIGDIILTTKVDRINLYQDGSYEIIDYKTGTLPAPKEIKSGLEPQLAVEAIVLTKGKIKNYSELKILQVNNLQYQNLKGKDQNEAKDLSDIDKLITAADDGILRLLEIFNDQNFGYICCPNIDIYKEDDYWHLARTGEL